MLETVYIDANFKMLVTDSLYLKNDQPEEKNQMHNDSATNILNLSPTKHCHQHHCSPVFCHESVSIMTHLWHSMMVTPVRANEWYYKIAIASPSGQRNLSVMCWVHRIKWDLRHSENEFLNIPSTSRRPCFSIDEISARTPSLWQFELQISQFTPYTYTIMTHLWYW